MFCLIVSGRAVGRLVRGGVLYGVLLRRVCCWPPRVNLWGRVAIVAASMARPTRAFIVSRSRAVYIVAMGAAALRALAMSILARAAVVSARVWFGAARR